MNIWQILEIEMTTDVSIIKNAYAKKIKICKPEIDPEGFQLVRSAYEVALKYAQGQTVNHDLINPNSTEKAHETPAKTSSLYFDPANAALHLLDVLAENEDSATDLINKFQRDGILDNIEFSDQFQHVLSVNLLVKINKHPGFICFLIDFFKWQEKTERNISIFGIAKISLINHTQYYRFFQYLKKLCFVKNKKSAKQQNLDWRHCCAAKNLFNPPSLLKFFLIKKFCKKKKQALIDIVKEIKEGYPQTLGMGLNIQSIAWWDKVKTSNDIKIIYPEKYKPVNKSSYFNYIVVFSIVIFFLNIFKNASPDSTLNKAVDSTTTLQSDSKPNISEQNIHDASLDKPIELTSQPTTTPHDIS